jgi:hypothetical protein
MKRFLTCLVAFVLIAALLVSVTGCYGSFNLTKKLYTFNGSMGDKWVNEAMFLLLMIPAYGICGMLDVLFLNTIEFWTGNNPVTAVVVTPEEGTQVTFNAGTHRIEVSQGGTTYYITKANGYTTVTNIHNNPVAHAIADGKGGFTLIDVKAKTSRYLAASDVQTLAGSQ